MRLLLPAERYGLIELVGRGSAAGAHALAELFDELGRNDLAEVAERWLRA